MNVDKQKIFKTALRNFFDTCVYVCEENQSNTNLSELACLEATSVTALLANLNEQTMWRIFKSSAQPTTNIHKVTKEYS